MELKAVLFDFGHTLFDVRDPGELVARTARQLKVQVDVTEALRVWESIAQAAGTPEELARERDISAEAHRSNWIRLLAPLERFGDGLAEAVYRAHMAVENWEPYVDSLATLRSLKAAGVAVAIVSDTGFDLRPIFWHHCDGEQLVDGFVLSFEHGRVKPDRMLFEAALRTVGARPDEALMVGDNPATDGGASALGVPALILPPAHRGHPRGFDTVLRLVLSPKSVR